MSTDDSKSEPNLERTREEKFKSLIQRECISEETREIAKRALLKIQEGSA